MDPGPALMLVGIEDRSSLRRSGPFMCATRSRAIDVSSSSTRMHDTKKPPALLRAAFAFREVEPKRLTPCWRVGPWGCPRSQTSRPRRH